MSKDLPQTMRAVTLEGPHRLVERELPIPVFSSDEVILRVRACGICGSDVHYLHGKNPYAMIHHGIVEPNPENMILGHEVAGEIADARGNGERRGERVAVEPFQGCGECFYCTTGNYNLCRSLKHHGHDSRWGVVEIIPGGYAEYMPCWSEKAYRIPDNVSFDAASILDGLAVGVHALNRGGMKPGAVVIVLGAGPIGLKTAMAARGLGAGKVICTDIQDYILETVEDLDFVPVDARKRDYVSELKKLSGGEGADVVVDTVGADDAHTVEEGLEATRPQGSLVMLAATACKLPVTFAHVSGERTLTTSGSFGWWGTQREFAIAVGLLARGLAPLERIVTHRFPLSDIVEAFEVAQNKPEHRAIKIVINP